MAKPLVAIVGRPNVGKSTFFNKICGKRISIVNDVSGVTRDRVYADVEWCGYQFTVIDTGGLELKSQDTMWKHIRTQAEIAIDIAEVILFFVDIKQGIMPDDHDIAKLLRKTKKRVILVVNKADHIKNMDVVEFFELGLGVPIAISSEQSLGLGDLLDEVVAEFEKSDESDMSSPLKIAIVGKPNVGKSSLVNKLLGFERVIVSDIAGTTRDAIDTPFAVNDKDYILIDTAGMRRKRSVDEDVEAYSVMRTLDAIRRCDVAVILFDSSDVISEQDIRICGFVHEQNKPSVIIMNKWDLVEKDTNTINKYVDNLNGDLKFMDYFKVLFISALNGQRVDKIIGFVEEAYQNSIKHLPTGVLNEILQGAVTALEPPTKNGRRLKIYYVTQARQTPPTFVIFVNDNTLIHFSYERYLENCFRKSADFSGTPIKIVFRNKNEKDI